MGLRVAVANGNWSNPATWNGGVLPAAGDIVASNNFNITIDQDVNVGALTNAAQSVVSAIPTMTSNTTPSGIATAFFAAGLTFPAYYAFNGEISNNFFQNNLTLGDYVGYEFPSVTAIDQFAVQFGGTTSISMSLQGWNGTTWVNISTVSCSAVAFYTSPVLGNSTAYIKYKLVFNTAVYCQIREIYFYEYLGTTAAVAGGGFFITSTQTITCTGTGIIGGGTTVITNTSPGTVNINSTYIYGVNNWTINHNAIGVLNITSNLTANAGGNTGGCLLINNTGTVNIVGTITTTAYALCVRVNTANTLNITGDVRSDSVAGGPTTISVVANNSVVNITGNIYGQTLTGTSVQTINLAANNCTLNITGSIFPVTGTNVGNAYVIYTTTTHYIKIIGTLNSPSYGINPVLVHTSSTGINILSGPFISGATGIQPFFVSRMHYLRTIGSYFEFRDNSTNGALPPAGPAPATRLVAPGTPIDSPIPANVRQGVTYALGSLTGTMVVPSPSNVANNVPVDNTVGTAVLDPNAIWSVPLTSINTLNSIGRRVKNAATVETTGAQLESLIRANE